MRKENFFIKGVVLKFTSQKYGFFLTSGDLFVLNSNANFFFFEMTLRSLKIMEI